VYNYRTGANRSNGCMKNHLEYLKQRRFESLDGLRAVSIIAVIWHHTYPAGMSTVMGSIGAEGVTLFFAISGFLITTLLLREHDRNGIIDLKEFYIRRILRIFPLYYGTLLIYILVVALIEGKNSIGKSFFSNLLYFSTFTSNLFVKLDGRVIFYFAWSVAAEEQFYLIWPPVLKFFVAYKRISVLIFLATVAYVSAIQFGFNVLSVFPSAIFIGALLGLALHSRWSFRLLYLLLGQRWSSIIVAAALFFALIEGSISVYLLHTIFVALVGSCVIREDNFLASTLRMRPVAYIGSISYGMYMLHMLSRNVVLKLLDGFNLNEGGLEVFLLTSITALIVASLSYKRFESVFLKMKKSHSR